MNSAFDIKILEAAGIPLISQFAPKAAITIVKVHVAAGSGDEVIPTGDDFVPYTRGVAHLFEHWPFRGTQNFTLEQLERLKGQGIQIGAATGLMQTVYTVSGPSTENEKLVQIASEMVCRPLMNPDDYSLERNIVEAEMVEGTGELNRVMWARFVNAVIPSPLTYPIIGATQEDVITNIPMADAVRFHKEMYTKQRVTIGISGGLSHEDAQNLVTQYFQLPDGVARPKVELPFTAGHSREVILPSALGAIHEIAFDSGTDIPTRLEKKIDSVLMEYLLGDTTGTLSSRMRGERALVYGIRSSHLCIFGRMMNGIVFTSQTKNNMECLQIVAQGLRELTSGMVDADLLNDNIAKRAHNLRMTMRNAETKALEPTTIIDEFRDFGDVIPFEQEIELLSQITPDHLVERARKVFSGPIHYSVLNNQRNAPTPEAFNELFGFLRDMPPLPTRPEMRQAAVAMTARPDENL